MSKDFAKLIDRARLRDAIVMAKGAGWENVNPGPCGFHSVLLAAAHAHLATLEPPKREPVMVYDLSARGSGLVSVERTFQDRTAAANAAHILVLSAYSHIVITERVLP